MPLKRNRSREIGYAVLKELLLAGVIKKAHVLDALENLKKLGILKGLGEDMMFMNRLEHTSSPRWQRHRSETLNKHTNNGPKRK